MRNFYCILPTGFFSWGVGGFGAPRHSLVHRPARRALRPGEISRRTRNGVPLLPLRPNSPRDTSEVEHPLREELL